MASSLLLHHLLSDSARRAADSVAVQSPDGALTYGELDQLANRFARLLLDLGVSRGDRVGIWLDKSATTIAAMQGALRIGAAYVPMDPLSPPARAQAIIDDCAMRALISTGGRVERALRERSGVAPVVVASDGPAIDPSWPSEPVDVSDGKDTELAYILYTSGSTGRPKGVCISHRNALAFAEWAAHELDVTAGDRLANHAPFHFDLSVLDLYVTFRSGASVFLISDDLSYVPDRLVDFIVREELTIWYSVPSALILMIDQGGLLDIPSLPLRAVLFAGEAFPLNYLRRLRDRWPSRRYLNLYGPTETNVCTFFEVDDIPVDKTRPVPIGRACSGDRVWAVKADGTEARPGEEGELQVTGPTVMLGYWGHPPHRDQPYATGDIVRLQKDGNFEYIGRRDHMVKVRGHRIELGDIEATLDSHPAVREVAVAVVGDGMEAALRAYVVSDYTPTLLELKRHCAERLPRYMVVDHFVPVDSLPRTRNGKIDRRLLQQIC